LKVLGDKKRFGRELLRKPISLGERKKCKKESLEMADENNKKFSQEGLRGKQILSCSSDR